MSTPRFNLRNASLYLTKLKNKYQKQQQNEDDNVYDNTFIDEEDELTSNPSMQKLSPKKINSSNTDRYQSEHIPQIKLTQQSPSPRATQTIQYQDKQTQQTEFCDLIVIKYLEETLAIYKGDLEILEHNRQNLEQQIYFIGKKIGKLNELAAQNLAMTFEIQTLNENLKSIIAQYHESKKKVFMRKIALTKVFQKYQHKLKEFLLFDKRPETDLYLKTDCLTSSYIDEYTAFLNYKRQQSNQISTSLKNPQISEKSNKALIKKIFEGKQQIYLPEEEKPKPSQSQTQKQQQVLQESEKKKQKKVVLYDEFANDDEQFGHKSKDTKGKKMTEAQKNLLLGDLKNFSKSFKIPK